MYLSTSVVSTVITGRLWYKYLYLAIGRDRGMGSRLDTEKLRMVVLLLLSGVPNTAEC